MRVALARDVRARLDRWGVVHAHPVPLEVRERTAGDVSVLSMRGSGPSELTIDTPSTHPDHSIFAFVSAESVWSKLSPERWQGIDDDLAIAPYGTTRALRFRGPWSASVLYVPRTALASFVPTLSAGLHMHSDRRPLDRAMQRFIDGMFEADVEASAIERYAVEQLVMEMSGAVLLDRVGVLAAQGSPREALRARAIAVIAQQCADAALTPERVAREVRSSLRQVQVVFAEAGNTIAGEIRRQRARLAKSLLTQSRYDVLSIEQVARRSGFQSPMSMRRALDEAYGMTPRALRSARRS